MGEAQLVDKENKKVKKKADEIFEKEIGDEMTKYPMKKSRGDI